MKKILSLLLTVLTIASCNPTPEQIQAAIKQTQIATPTTTYTFVPSSTIAPSLTSTITITPTPTSTPTITPTVTLTPDVRIIKDDPLEFLLKSEDLPKEGAYYQPGADFVGITTNEEIIQNMQNGMGQELVDRTGRITAWFSIFMRGNNSVNFPELISIVITQYENSAGANLALDKYNQVLMVPESKLEFIEHDTGLGDKFIVYGKAYTKPNGVKGINRSLDYSYRNFVVSVSVLGRDKEVNYDFALIIARIILEKLEGANLVVASDK